LLFSEKAEGKIESSEEKEEKKREKRGERALYFCVCILPQRKREERKAPHERRAYTSLIL